MIVCGFLITNGTISSSKPCGPKITSSWAKSVTGGGLELICLISFSLVICGSSLWASTIGPDTLGFLVIGVVLSVWPNARNG